MSIRALDLFHIAVPLKKSIKHASHERTVSDNLVVRVTLDSGQVGFGEGVPRPYVTGETIETTFAALSNFDAARHLGRPIDFAEAVARIDAISLPETEADPRGMAGNAARCALELALLDAYARLFGGSVAEAVGLIAARRGLPPQMLRDRPSPVRYSGAITAETGRKERISAWKMRLYGFAQVKVKVGVDGQDDPARLAKLRRILGHCMDIRIDANEAWSPAELIDRVLPILPSRPTALEQPVPHADLEALAEWKPKLGLDVMLDESLCGIPDARRALDLKVVDCFNVRLSKCGGIGPSLQIMGMAKSPPAKNWVDIQLGCHPGETGLLSAAGRHVAGMIDPIRYLEGSYDRHVLARNLTVEDITFGYGGRARPLSGPGLGVTVDSEALETLTVARREVRYD